jgi:transcriptional regulator with XRE-family HTH domain
MDDHTEEVPIWAARLQELTLATGLTQAEIARRAGLQRDAYGRYVLGKTKPPLRRIRAIASALGVKPGEISEEWAHMDSDIAGPAVAQKWTMGATARPGIVRMEFSGEVTLEEAGRFMSLLREVQEREQREHHLDDE